MPIMNSVASFGFSHGGASDTGGHAFVCDGYQFKDNAHLFHINWGWGPHSNNDGYYNIEVLAPIDYSQPEKGVQMPGFTRMQNILRGLYPDAKAQPKELFCSKFCLNHEEAITLKDGMISLPILMKAANTSYPQFSTYLAAIVVDKQEQKHVIPLSEEPIDFPFTNELLLEAKDNFSINFDYQESFGKEFRMYLAYRNSSTEEWKECRGNSWCAFTVKDDNTTVDPFVINPFELNLTDSGVTGNTIVPEGTTVVEDIRTNNDFMLYAEEGDELEVRFIFDGNSVKPGSYKVYLYGQTSLQYAELFTLTVTEASDIRQVPNGLQQAAEGPAYNLQGHAVSDSYRGVVIKNGKKALRKCNLPGI